MSEPIPWFKQPIAVLDTETTGLNPDQGDRIVELGVVLFDDGVLSGSWGTLLDPGMPLPKDTTRITGITPEDVAGQPAFADIADVFLGHLANRLLVAYNASFDRTFVLEELAKAGRSLPDGAIWIDPLVLVKEVQRGQGNMKLGTVARRLGVPLDEAHRATADAECAGHVLMALVPDLPSDLTELLDLQERWEAKQNAERGAWRNRPRRGSLSTVMDAGGPKNALGAAYPHGDELDPVRYMFLRGTGRV